MYCALWKSDEENSSLSELVLVCVCTTDSVHNHLSLHVVDTLHASMLF